MQFEIEAACRHNRSSFEFPDVNRFSDYLRFSADYSVELARVADSSEYVPDPLTLLPYPKSDFQLTGKLRWMSVLSLGDLALCRYDAGKIAAVTDRILTDRVYSYRLQQFRGSNRAWCFADSRKAYKSFRNKGLTLLDHPDHSFMARTDVTQFYPSISSDRLEELLLAVGCNLTAVERAIQRLRGWQTISNLRGIPIGPEFSAILANFYLSNVDQSITGHGIKHLRYSDDILAFAESRAVVEAIIALIATKLHELRLEISPEKTEIFDDPWKAKRSLQDPLLASLDSLVEDGPQSIGGRISWEFDREILECEKVDLSRYRYIIGRLTRLSDDSRCLDLCKRMDLMNLDPKISCYYMRKANSQKHQITEELMKLISAPPAQGTEALAFHSLETISHMRIGTNEADPIEAVAADKAHRSWPVRSVAWKALAHCDGVKASRLMDAAEATDEAPIRRAIIVSMWRFASERRSRRFFEHSTDKYPEIKYAIEWVKGQAA